MKKTLFLFISVLLAVALTAAHATAANVGSQEALAKAIRFMNSQAGLRYMTSGATLKLTHSEKSQVNAQMNDFYVFNYDNGGYVIVSGDDRAEEILGYGSGYLDMDNLPPNVAWWIGHYKEQMEFLLSNPKLEVETTTQMMQSMLTATTVPPLLTSTWGQHAPYYNQCPIYNGQYCVTGCSATAMAQVMYYWKYPAVLPSVAGYYQQADSQNGYPALTLNDLPATTLDWNNMRDSYSGNYTTAHANAVAKLMRYCGQAAKMKYSPDGSGAKTSDQRSAIVMFGYSSEAQMVKKNNYTSASWVAMMQAELEANRPILYGGNYTSDDGGNGGHAFVVDGYDANTSKYHVNFGWSGSDDNYYALDAFTGNGHTYKIDQDMIINVYPEGCNCDFVVDGICFNITGTNTVEVTSKSTNCNSYSGNVDIPNSVTYRGNTYNVTAIGDGAFMNCQYLSSVTIPNSTIIIGMAAFSGCTSLHEVTIPNSVTTIGEGAFGNCESLGKVAIGKKVIYIASRAFADCPSLTDVTCWAISPPMMVASNVFDSGTYSGATLTVPRRCKSAYQSANWWNNFTHITEYNTEENFTFCVNGIYYDIISSTNKTVAVVPPGNMESSYSGSVTIPSTVTNNGTTYTVTYIGEAAFYDCSGLTNVSIPNTVTSIGVLAFRGCSGLTSVSIPDAVTDIGDAAFSYCTGLTSVTIPNSVKWIEPEAFEGCSNLTSVTLGNGMEQIYRNAFAGCPQLLNVTCLTTTPPEIEIIGSEGGMDFDCHAFDNNTLRNGTLTVPHGLKSAYQAADGWKDFSQIQEITYDFVVNGIYYAITGSNTVKVTSRNNNSNSYSGSVTIPSSVTYGGKTYSVTAIGSGAFAVCSGLTSVSIPNSVTSIGDVAFTYCTSLNNVVIPNSVTTIGELAFHRCNRLTDVTIGNSVTTIGEQAFYFAGLTSVIIPSSVKTIGEYAFYGCTALSSVSCLASTPPTMAASNVFSGVTYSNAILTVPRGRKSAYQAANWWSNFSMIFEINYDFIVNGIYYLITGTNTVAVSYRDGNYNSYSGSVSIPSSVTYEGTTYQVTAIGDYAFNSCTGLTSVTIPNTVTSIGDNAFQQCGTIESIVIPNSVTSIGNLAFMLCDNITYMVIPNSVTTIGVGVFLDCQRLEHVVIGSSVTSIGEGAFMECGRLNNVECLATTPPTMAASNVFDDSTYGTATLTVPGRSLSAYQNDNYWKYFTHIQGDGSFFMVNGIYYAVTGDNTVEVTFKDTNFNSYSGNVTIPQTVTYDGKTYNVTTIGKSAFRESSGLTSVVIPVSVIEIDDDAFYYCSGLTSVVIPSKVTTIGDYVFYGCTSMTNVTLGSSVSSIGFQAFRVCPALLSVTSLATTPPTIKSTTFVNSQYSSVMLFVPKASLGAYQSKTYWKNFTQMHPTLDYALNSADGSVEFFSGGNYPWTNVVEDGRVYAVSGNKGIPSSTSTLIATVTLSQAGSVTFDYKAWGEGSDYDVCTFWVGAMQISYGNKQNDWENYTVQLPAGTSTLTWTYSKNESVNPPGDYFAIDNVVIKINTTRGDVDCDGQVTIADVTEMMDLILAGGANVDAYPFADVDGDGSLTIADATGLIDYLLVGTWDDEPSDVHEWVDLGLPSGTLWATCNVGANSPEEYGDYFAWGEVEPKGTYDWTTYKWCNGSSTSLTKYCTNSYFGTVDNKTELDPEDDAAHVNWGVNWRMPTKEQQQELYVNCTAEWTMVDGTNGYLITGPNGNTLFLPAPGYRWSVSLYDWGMDGYYWSRSLGSTGSYDPDNPDAGYDPGDAFNIYFYSTYWFEDNSSRRPWGCAVRPVRVSQN